MQRLYGMSRLIRPDSSLQLEACREQVGKVGTLSGTGEYFILSFPWRLWSLMNGVKVARDYLDFKNRGVSGSGLKS